MDLTQPLIAKERTGEASLSPPPRRGGAVVGGDGTHGQPLKEGGGRKFSRGPASVAGPGVPSVATGAPSRVIVHIGVHKTGSTAIQTLLQRNTDSLADRGVFYAPTLPEEYPNHNPLGAAFLPGAEQGVGERGLQDLLERAGSRVLLISSEMLCHPKVDAARFMRELGGRNVEVFAYVRHPCDILVSAFNERVREYKAHYLRGIEERPLAYDPSQLTHLRPWLEHPGAKVVLAPYDAPQWSGGTIFSDFLAMIGIPSTGLEMDAGRINESLPFAAIELLRAFNAMHPTEQQHKRRLEQLRAMTFEVSGYPLAEDIGRECLERMRKALPEITPYFRPGFTADYLFAERPWKTVVRSA